MWDSGRSYPYPYTRDVFIFWESLAHCELKIFEVHDRTLWPNLLKVRGLGLGLKVSTLALTLTIRQAKFSVRIMVRLVLGLED